MFLFSQLISSQNNCLSIASRSQVPKGRGEFNSSPVQRTIPASCRLIKKHGVTSSQGRAAGSVTVPLLSCGFRRLITFKRRSHLPSGFCMYACLPAKVTANDSLHILHGVPQTVLGCRCSQRFRPEGGAIQF